MRVLIVGDDPANTGGVVNYSRPLAGKLAKLGHEVQYFCSGAWNSKYNWLMFPYLNVRKGEETYPIVEMINSPNLAYNYGNPLTDVESPEFERVFSKYIQSFKPDVVHIHSIVGSPASLMRICFSHGCAVFNTIHVYEYLCQKRVMIDYKGALCDGPFDYVKCSICCGKIDSRKKKMKMRLRRTIGIKYAEFLYKKYFFKQPTMRINDSNNVSATSNNKIVCDLKERKTRIIDALNNYCTMNICVSNDAKSIMMKYGVREDKLLVQHIGSTIAEKRRKDIVSYNGGKIIFANIGGVTHYKGTHILIEAFKKLATEPVELRIYGWYNKSYVNSLLSGYSNDNIRIFGRYNHSELSRLLQDVHVVILPSICNDTAPQTIFEAFSNNIPIIASNIGGFPDFVEDRITGFLVQPGDPHDLEEKIRYIVLHPTIIREMSSCIKPVKSITQNANELVALYRSARQLLQ